MLVIAQMLSEFGLHTAFENCLDHLRQEPTLTGQRDPSAGRGGNQLIQKPIIEQLTPQLACLRLALVILHSHSQSPAERETTTYTIKRTYMLVGLRGGRGPKSDWRPVGLPME